MSFYERFTNDPEWVDWAVQCGIRDALIKHKAMGVAIASRKDGKVVLIPAEQIEIPDPGPDPRLARQISKASHPPLLDEITNN